MLLPPTLLPVFCDDNMVLIGHSASGKWQEQNVKRGIFSEPLKDCIAQKWLRILRFEEKSIRTVLVAVCNVQGDWTEKFKVKEWRNAMLWKVWILWEHSEKHIMLPHLFPLKLFPCLMWLHVMWHWTSLTHVSFGNQKSSYPEFSLR